jgi:hypothetical protein
MDNRHIIGFTMIALAVMLVIFALAFRPFQSYIDIVIVVITLLLVSYAFIYQGLDSDSDSNSDDQGIGSGFGKGIGEHFAQLASSDFTKTLDSISSVAANANANGMQSNNRSSENISQFAVGMTVYYSAFTPTSYPNTSRRWFNISPFFATATGNATCPDVKMDNTHMTFNSDVTYNKTDGFLLGRNFIKGPKSYQMGISMNDSFTIAFTMQFDSFSTSTTALQLFTLYANTRGNNGLSLYVANDYAKANETGDYTVKMFLAFGDMEPVPVKITTLNTTHVYIFLIQKSGQNLSLTIYPNVAATTASPSMFIDGIQMSIPLTQDVLLSNKELVINENGNLQAHIYNLAIWNKMISATSTIDFYNNVKTELQKNDPTLASLSGYISDLKKQVLAQKSCPYDTSTCAACSGVTDWTNMSDIILNAGSECLSKIDMYCTNNPTDAKCTCWNTSSALSSTEGCKSYKAIFNKDGPHCNVDNIDADTLDQIRKKYNMCGTTGTVATTGTGTATGAVASGSNDTPPVAPVAVAGPLKMLPAPAIPRMLNNIYAINSSDIEVYNNIKVAATSTASTATASNGMPNVQSSFSSNVDGNVFKSLWDKMKPK